MRAGLEGVVLRPDWRRVWEDSYVRIRDQMRGEWAAGHSPRAGMRRWCDREIDRRARAEANRRCEESINRHNEEITKRAA